MNQATGTTAEKHIPAMLISGEPLPIKYLQFAGATSGQVPTYNGTTVVWSTPSVTPGSIALTSAHLLVGNGSNMATDVAVSGDLTLANTGAFTIANTAVTTAKILDANVTLAKLATGIAPSHIVKFAGKITWSGSGASLATTIAGIAATDIVMATIQGAPTQAAYLVSAAPTTNTLTLVLSAANTGNDAVIAYTVFRAAS